MSLVNQTSLSAFLSLLNQIPLGIPFPLSSPILPVLSDAFIVTFAFSPRYTVTFGKFESAVPSVKVISRPSSPTSFTTGLTVSTTSTVIVFSSDCFPWLSVALYFTVYVPRLRVLISLVVALLLTERISTCFPFPLVRFLSSS